MLLVEVKEWIEKMVLLYDSESFYGEYRNLEQMLADDAMPEVYHKVLKELNK